MRLFQEKGFDAVSVGLVAKEAGVSVPTFYAHFPGKEHVVMPLPTPEQMAALAAGQPADLPLDVRLRQAAHAWVAAWTPEVLDDTLARWKIVAATPALRNRAAEFERTTAGMLAGALPSADGATLSPAEAVVLNAHLAAYTSALLSWADSEGKDDLVTLIDMAFAALQGGSSS
jgi:AcrR family transcriptional regulator